MKIIKILAYIIAGFFALFVVLGIIGAIFSSDADTTSKTTEVVEKEVPKEENKPVEPAKPTYLWRYSESTDEMDNKKNYFAVLTSDNELNFDFPYSGGSSGYLTIRNMDGKNSVAISIEKGQFMTSYDNSEYIRIKFDDAVLEKYNFNGAADGSSDYIFPTQSSKLITKLKKAKTIKIEAHFYNEGRQVLNFTTEGLEWDK